MNRNQLYFLKSIANIASWVILVIGIIVCLLLPWWTFLILVAVFLGGVVLAGYLETLANNKTDPDDLIFDGEKPIKADKNKNIEKDSTKNQRDDMIFDE